MEFTMENIEKDQHLEFICLHSYIKEVEKLNKTKLTSNIDITAGGNTLHVIEGR